MLIPEFQSLPDRHVALTGVLGQPERQDIDSSVPDQSPPRTQESRDCEPGQKIELQPLVTTVLVAASPGLAAQLTSALLELSIDRVLQAWSISDIKEIVAGPIAGDLAVVSVTFGASSQRLIRELRLAGWRRVIALVPTAFPAAIIAALEAGASGILRRGPESLALGDPVDAAGPVQDLSLREVQIIRLVADGQPNKEISQHLGLSPLSVKSHLARIGHKLGTGDRAHIVAIALRAGIID